ncbi:MAG TPA: pitrilysin family protein [Alphaproteobacteria bacterium]|nr:pitrilysin family protein [Alphaproteobacteria bacterium]
MDVSRRPLRRWWPGIVVAAVMTFAALGAQAQVFNPETMTLPNGLLVVAIPNHRSPIVTQMVWYKIGAGDEVPGKSGIAHFLEHLMFKGTKAVPPGEFSKIVGRNGGRDNAFTSYDYTAYFQSIARDRLELVMKLESDRMRNLVLNDASVLPERDVILEERRSRIDNNPDARLTEQMQAALYLNSPYHRPIIGWEHEMEQLTTQDAIAWYRRYYTPNNAILIVAGDITMAQLKPLAEKYYGPIPSRPVPPRVRPTEPPPEVARRVELKDPRVRQTVWTRLYLAPSYMAGDKQYADALQVLAEIFGGGVTSRLHKSLVIDRPLATSAGAFYDPDALGLTQFGISAALRPDAKLDELEAAMNAEIKRLVDGGVTADEVQRAERRLRADVVYARDSLQAGARAIGEAITTGTSIAQVETWPARIAAVTPEQVTAAARAVFRDEGSVTGVLLPKPSS